MMGVIEFIGMIFKWVTWILIPIAVGAVLAYTIFDSAQPLSYLASPYIFVLCVAGGVKLEELTS